MRIAVGLSGGVDSSVAALLLKRAGHDVVGVTMRLWKEGRYKGGARDACFGPGEADDIATAAAFAEKIGIPHHVIDCADAYEREIVSYFREASRAGLTPNPCVICNARIKFGLLPELAASAGIAFDRFATGHYARITERGGRFALLRGWFGTRSRWSLAEYGTLCLKNQTSRSRVMRSGGRDASESGRRDLPSRRRPPRR